MRLDDPARPRINGNPAFLINGIPQGICILNVRPGRTDGEWELITMLPVGPNRFSWHGQYVEQGYLVMELNSWRHDPEAHAEACMGWKPWAVRPTTLQKVKLSLSDLFKPKA